MPSDPPGALPRAHAGLGERRMLEGQSAHGAAPGPDPAFTIIMGVEILARAEQSPAQDAAYHLLNPFCSLSHFSA